MGFYVYIHRKKSNGEVFYVGKGRKRRAWSTEGRNTIWQRITAKHAWEVEIVESNLQEWYAFELEKDLIALYGRRDDGYGALANLTDGGEGPSGVDCAQTDLNTYNFYNFNTKETFRGLRINFKNKYNIDPAPLFHKKSNRVDIHIKGWLLYDKEVPEKVRVGFAGELAPNIDRTIFNFINMSTGETWTGTKMNFRNKTGLDTANMFNKGVANKFWFCIEVADLMNMYYSVNEGRPNPNATSEIYTFENFDGELFTGTRSEIRSAKGVKTEMLFCINPVLSYKGWFLQAKREEVLSARNDMDEYDFYNIATKETLRTTRRKFQDKYMDVAIHHIFNGNCTTIKNWTIPELVDPDELRKSTDGRVGADHHMSCSIIYDFINVNTEEKFRGTRTALQQKIGAGVSDLFRETAKVCKGWTFQHLYDTTPIAVFKNKRIDTEPHVFVNEKTGERFEGIKFDFKQKFGVSATPLFGNRGQKTTKGWSLSPKEIQEFS